MCIRTLVCFFCTALGVVGCSARSPVVESSPVPADCTKLDSLGEAAHPAEGQPFITLPEQALQGVNFVTIFVDSYRIAWNHPKNSGGPFPGPRLDPEDIQTIEVYQPGRAPSDYSICPGVGLIVINTKSRSWRPTNPVDDP